MAFIVIASCNDSNSPVMTDSIIASGQMPDVVKDNSDNLHLVYGTGDSIMYAHSSDHGETFSASSLISVLPKLGHHIPVGHRSHLLIMDWY